MLRSDLWRCRGAVLRDRLPLAVLLIQGLVLDVWAHGAGGAGGAVVLALALVALCAALALAPMVPRLARRGAVAVGLLAESALAAHLSGGIVGHVHPLAMLALIAVYEEAAPVLLGAAAVALAAAVWPATGGRQPFGAGDVASVVVVALALAAVARAVGRLRAAGTRATRRLEAFVEGAGTVVASLDRDARVTVVNRAMSELLGRPAAELVGSDWMELALPEPGRAASRAAFAEVMAGARPANPFYENDVMTPDGVRLVQWTSVVLDDDRGRPVGLLKSGIDITERRAVEREQREHARDLAVLRELAQQVAALDDARQAVTDGILRLADASMVALMEPSVDGETLTVTATTTEVVAATQIQIAREASGAGACFLSGKPFFVADARSSPVVSARLRERVGISSVLYEPVMADGKPVGVLIVGWETPVAALGSRRTDLVTVAAHEAAVAVQRVAAVRRLSDAALTDALTGIANRRAFDGALKQALQTAARSDDALGMAMLDLNGFKALNDTQGHAAGDRLLKEVAAGWRAALRPDDVLARLGGDEFAILLPGCRPEDAKRVVARLHGAVTHQAGVGIGLVWWDRAESASGLLRRADEALYADKATGKAQRLADPERLAAVAACGAAGGRPELDRLAEAVGWALGVPVALVTLVDDRRQAFPGLHGLTGWAADTRGTPLSHSFCRHVLTTAEPLIVDDARLHELVRGNPAIVELGVVAYAGVPLTDAAGHHLGALCAIDDQPRSWSEQDIAILRRFAEAAACLVCAPPLGAPAAGG
jgi:diguanylate cyclase (GGDEF)-like protein/PAS domain S-box-containing protein